MKTGNTESRIKVCFDIHQGALSSGIFQFAYPISKGAMSETGKG